MLEASDRIYLISISSDKLYSFDSWVVTERLKVVLIGLSLVGLSNYAGDAEDSD